MTKLLTSIAAMQLVERRFISLDDDVSPYVPELAEKKVLVGFDGDGKPQLKDRVNPLKFRYLLTHSAGTSYQFQDPRLQRYSDYLYGPPDPKQSAVPGKRSEKTVVERFWHPLCYEPGTGWEYSPSLDWAGKVIEKLTGMTLEDYMQKNIFEPLGIKGITFWPDKHPDIKSRMTALTIRDPLVTGRVKDYSGPSFNDGVTECMGGQGCYADLEDYLKIVHNLLVTVTDDDHNNDVPRLLKKETVLEMFQPQLTKQSQEAQAEKARIPERVKLFVGYFPSDVVYDWGIGGILVNSERPQDGNKEISWGARRKKGTLIWSGLPNLYWVSHLLPPPLQRRKQPPLEKRHMLTNTPWQFIDPSSSLCGVFGTFVLPSGDPKIQTMIRHFEEGIYDLASHAQSQSR